MSTRARPKRMAGKHSTYWPPGDIMNFWPILLRVASERMLPGRRPRYLQTLLDLTSVPDEVAQEAMLRYIQAQKLVHLDPDVHDLDTACARDGVLVEPQPAQAGVFMLTGELATGIYIAGVKDATPLGETGIRDDVESLVWAAEEHTRKLRG